MKPNRILLSMASLTLGVCATLITPPAEATPVIVTPITISVPPVSTNVNLGKPASFKVTASGPASLKYQWYSIVGSTTNKLVKDTSSTLSFAKVTAANAGEYEVEVIDASARANVAYSDPVTLTINTDVLVLTNQNDGYGSGTVAPTGPIKNGVATNGAALFIGQTYKLKATPGANSYIAWLDINGNVLSEKDTLSFTMDTNTYIEAYFFTNAILATGAAGTYSGLFLDEGEFYQTNGIFLENLVLKNNGKFSGKLALNGAKYGFSGTLDMYSHTSTITVKRTAEGLSDLVIYGYAYSDYDSDYSNWDNYFNGMITNEDSVHPWAVYGFANQGVADFVAESNATYDVLFYVGEDDAPTNAPGGIGYLSILSPSNAAGKVTISGKLPDGTPVSESVDMDLYGDIPLYFDLYNHQGSFAGWINLEDFVFDYGYGPVSVKKQSYARFDEANWYKPSTAGGALYPKGFFATDIFLDGSPFDATNGMSPIEFPDPNYQIGVLEIDGVDNIITNHSGEYGAGTGYFDFNVAINNDNQIVKLADGPTNSLSGIINPTTGAITLKFRPTGARKDIKLTGAVLQNGGYGPDGDTWAGGILKGTDETGDFFIYWDY